MQILTCGILILIQPRQKWSTRIPRIKNLDLLKHWGDSVSVCYFQALSLCRKLRIISDPRPVYRCDKPAEKIFSRTQNTPLAQLIRQQDQGEAAVWRRPSSPHPPAVAAACFGRAGRFFLGYSCVRMLRASRAAKHRDVAQKGTDKSFSKAMALRWLLTRKAAVLWSSSSGGAATQPPATKHRGPRVRACVRAGGHSDAVKWTSLPRFSVPPAVMVMPPPPPPWAGVYSALISGSSSKEDGASTYHGFSEHSWPFSNTIVCTCV